MVKKTVSKCGARFAHKKEENIFEKSSIAISESKIYKDEIAKQKKLQRELLQKKRSYTKKTPEIETGDFANLEDEI